MRKLIARQIAEAIDIKQFKKEYTGKEYYSNTFESFYSSDNDQYLYLLSYGVVIFSGYDEVKTSELFNYLSKFCKNPVAEKTWDQFTVHENAGEDRIGYNEMFVSKLTPDMMRIVMLNLGQSVALDYYSAQASQLLEATNSYTRELEIKGRLRITTKKLLKFIGKNLNMKNNIVDNLYIIDAPDETWENEALNKADNGLKAVLDIKDRFRDIDYQLQIVKENLDLFKDLLQHRRANLLEIIIIILILVEVFQMFYEKFFQHLFG
jgi:uncharacterized Rmd1/YagE family protein